MTTPITPTNTNILRDQLESLVTVAYVGAKMPNDSGYKVNIPAIVDQLESVVLTKIKAHNTQLVEAIEGMKEKRVDDDTEDFGSFCATCGLSTDTDLNTGKCYCDHFNRGLEAVKKIIEREV